MNNIVFHLRRFKLVHFEKGAQEPIGCLNGWKVYGYCLRNDALSCELLLRSKNMNLIDANHLIKGMAKLMKKACVGKPLESMYDDKQCHEAFTFTRSTGQEQKVYRIWPGGNVRIYFCYGLDKSITVFYGLSKRKDKLNEGEVSALSSVCEEFLVAHEENQLNIIVE